MGRENRAKEQNAVGRGSVPFSCQTGMRAGELLKIEYSWIGDNVLHVPAEATKTLSRRDVALSARAREILKLVMELSMNHVYLADLTITTEIRYSER